MSIRSGLAASSLAVGFAVAVGLGFTEGGATPSPDRSVVAAASLSDDYAMVLARPTATDTPEPKGKGKDKPEPTPTPRPGEVRVTATPIGASGPATASGPANPSDATIPGYDSGPCYYAYGFKILRDMIPTVVSDCVGNEWHNPENGDALQQTTGGLLVWRKADNWTAFTNGSITWINGPLGLQTRPNGDRFPWERTTAAAPSAGGDPSAPAPQPAPRPAATLTPTPQADAPSGPIVKQPAEITLGLGDLGKEISQVYQKDGSDNRSKWTEMRFLRSEKLVDAHLGPLKVVSRVYVANDVPSAQAIYQDEVGRQTKMPEAQDPLGGVYVNEDNNAVAKVGDEQDSRAGCNDDCGTQKFNRLHQRTVMRYQNVVSVLYFWGGRDNSTPAQVDEWQAKIRDRMG